MNQMIAGINFTTDTIKAIGYKNDGNVTNRALEFVGDITSTEVSGTNYTAGGATLANVTVTQSSGTYTIAADNITWAVSPTGFADCRYVVLAQDTGNPATSRLIGFIDLEVDSGNVTGSLIIDYTTPGTGVIYGD